MNSLEEVMLGVVTEPSDNILPSSLPQGKILGSKKPKGEPMFDSFLSAATKYFGDDPAVLAGLTGNAAVESAYSFDPAQKQIGGGGGRGVYQFDWHRKYYNTFLKENNLKDNVDSQNKYVYENIYGDLQNIVGEGNAKALQEAFKSGDPQLINETFRTKFLKPKKEKAHTDRRAAQTDFYFNKFTK
jgi:hypothetical protein